MGHEITCDETCIFYDEMILRVIDLFTFRAHIVIVAMTRQRKDLMMSRTKTHAFPIVLKTIIDDAHRDNKSFTLNDKQIRSRLRAKINTHMKNTSWVANNARDYDAIRCAFDATYATRVANARKRTSKTSKTNDVETPVA